MFASTFFDEPHGGLALGLSLFPLSAPSAMVARIAVADVPLWQILLSLGGLMLTGYGFVTLAARFFRPQNLLSTAGFNWKRVWTDWRD
jgi:ABC-2 type transport system permease protein